MSAKDFFKKLANAKDQFEEGRKGRGDPMIPVSVGKMIVRGHSIDLEVMEKTPTVTINAVVVHSEDPDNVGMMIKHRIRIEEMKGKAKATGKDYHITVADRFADVCTVLQKLGYQTDELELSELEEVGEDIAKNHPACRIEVVENGDYKNVKWRKFVDDADLPAIEDVMEDDADEESDDSDSDDDDDSDSDDEESDSDADSDDDEDAPPTKGSKVTAQPKGTKTPDKYTVSSVNVSKQLVTLVRIKDKKEFKLQPWSVIQ